MLEGLICALYELVVKSSQSEGKDRISAGHEFEQETARLVYSHEKIEGLKANPPRLTLQMPTISGLAYQFDVFYPLTSVSLFRSLKHDPYSSPQNAIHTAASILARLVTKRSYH